MPAIACFVAVERRVATRGGRPLVASAVVHDPVVRSSGAFVPGQPGPGDAVIINVPRTAFSHVGGSGINSASWNPTLVVNIPADSVAGLYSGTVNHSVT
ncbi:hypothetical protein [Actinopolymorpha pittospori]|uniref:Uncharacterized protein n=1 Tax=Actinopolymorpha pittospori TaxID=648752 RepID=A0A927MW38_9ACTN|nr:hypothetical protein [Actinopolymorpha pittospori]MBE1607357.1 hypothetical protein [Actinopolymorpha pittospori]